MTADFTYICVASGVDVVLIDYIFGFSSALISSVLVGLADLAFLSEP